MDININPETLKIVLNKILGKNIIAADCKTNQLQGGTVGNVHLVTGIAETDSGEKLPYKTVLKTQKKWERPGDPDSWRREYDLYKSDLDKTFTDSFGWADCYHLEMNEDETQMQMWIEYIDGVSGDNLTIEMLGKAAEELGHYQGGLYKKTEILNKINCLGEVDAVYKYYQQWHTQSFTSEFLCSDESWTPKHLKEIIKNNLDIWNNSKTCEYNFLRLKEFDIPKHLKQMLIDIDDNREIIFENIKRLPVVLCHRDFWQTNIFYLNGKIKLIDWDTAGWGYMGEDIAQLVVDETTTEDLHEYYRKLIPAYYKAILKYIDISHIENFYILELMIMQFGYRLVQTYMFNDSGFTSSMNSTQFEESNDVKDWVINRLQKIYELKDIKIKELLK